MERRLGWGGERAQCNACERCWVPWPGAELQDRLLPRAQGASCNSRRCLRCSPSPSTPRVRRSSPQPRAAIGRAENDPLVMSSSWQAPPDASCSPLRIRLGNSRNICTPPSPNRTSACPYLQHGPRSCPAGATLAPRCPPTPAAGTPVPRTSPASPSCSLGVEKAVSPSEHHADSPRSQNVSSPVSPLG